MGRTVGTRQRKRNILILLALGLLLLLAVLLSLRAGSYSTPLLELLRGLFGRASEEKINAVVALRLRRIVTAVFSGVGLGITGCILQAVLQNPLASSSTLGISQGASFGAAFAIIGLGVGTGGGAAGAASSGSASGLLTVTVCAFAGSMLVSLVILGLSRFRRISPETMVLVGVALSSMFTGATTLLQYFANDVELATFTFWTFGDLGSASWPEIGMIAFVSLASLGFFLWRRWDYNALYAGEQTAVSLGVNVKVTRVVNLLVCSFVAAVIVSHVGLISFIGLVAPHITRRLVGENYCYLIPGSAILGGALLLAGDLVARVVVSPVILPIGAITSFLGAPLFLYLLFRGRKA